MRIDVTVAACSFALLAAGGASAQLVILADERTVHAFAVADNFVTPEHSEQTSDDASPGLGEWVSTVAAYANITLAASNSRAHQYSQVTTDCITFAGDVELGGSSEDPDASVAGDCRSISRVTFRLETPQRLAIQASGGSTDGGSGGAVAQFTLTRAGLQLLVFDALQDPPLMLEGLYPAGDYEFFCEVSGEVSVPSVGGAGATASLLASVAIVPVCPGDANGDGVVDFLDLNHVLSDFGLTAPGLAGDLDYDGDCDFVDLNIVLSNFGAVC